MAVDHAQRARWISRVLRLRQASFGMNFENTVSTAETVDLNEGTEDAHTIGGDGHPLTNLIRSFNDIPDDEKYVAGLFDKSVEELVDESVKETAAAHEQMMSAEDVQKAYDSQDKDVAEYQEQAESMLDSGDWPVPHRLGHTYAMKQEGSA